MIPRYQTDAKRALTTEQQGRELRSILAQLRKELGLTKEQLRRQIMKRAR